MGTSSWRPLHLGEKNALWFPQSQEVEIRSCCEVVGCCRQLQSLVIFLHINCWKVPSVGHQWCEITSYTCTNISIFILLYLFIVIIHMYDYHSCINIYIYKSSKQAPPSFINVFLPWASWFFQGIRPERDPSMPQIWWERYHPQIYPNLWHESRASFLILYHGRSNAMEGVSFQ